MKQDIRNIDVVLLVGGLGTRLRPVIGDTPKCLAPINGKAFIDIQIDYLIKQGFQRFILCVGHKANRVREHIESREKGEFIFSVESSPLGTGGAIIFAMKKIQSKNFFVLNGDSYFPIDLKSLYDFHLRKKPDITIAGKHMEKPDRYGIILVNRENRVVGFKEKGSQNSALINGGVYIISSTTLMKAELPEVFSFENEILQRKYYQKKIFCCPFYDYFVDIGVPTEFYKANQDLQF
tara:strand:+ start:18 stop:725 length:708 start_codon:yes stop_codon:yes gene_type:complete